MQSYGLMRIAILLSVFVANWNIAISSQVTAAQSEWWNTPYQKPVSLRDAKKLPVIRVRGNAFVDVDGESIRLRGLSISDPDKIEKQGHWGPAHFQAVKDMGADVVRIPVHPAAWRERTATGYLKLLDEAVTWCTELGMYVIIDWHSIGNLGMELFQHPMYNTSKKETYEFWKAIAQHFAGNNTVAFYELFNEPTLYRGQLGSMSWDEWKTICENIIHLIRAYDTETIPLVAGFDWAYDLSPLLTSPIACEGIGYVTHPYAFKRTQPWEPKWEENFGFAAAKWPVFATEFGLYLENDETIGPDHYGNRILAFLESKGISWACWVFDPEWHPQMLKSWDYDLTPGGQFFKEKMQQKRNTNTSRSAAEIPSERSEHRDSNSNR